MWEKTNGIDPIKLNEKVLAWDSIGKTIGIWDGYCFDSITGGYSFDTEYSKGMSFYSEVNNKLVGKITHWMPLPNKPAARNCGMRKFTSTNTQRAR